jgi:hypothetical protein
MAKATTLVSLQDVGVILGGLSRSHTAYFARRPDFPAPVAEIAGRRLWNRRDVERWFAKWQTTPDGKRAMERRAERAVPA